MSTLDERIKELRTRISTSFEVVEREITCPDGRTLRVPVKVYPPMMGGDGLLPADRDSDRERSDKARSRSRGTSRSAKLRRGEC